LRERLDEVDPRRLRAVFKRVFTLLRQSLGPLLTVHEARAKVRRPQWVHRAAAFVRVEGLRCVPGP